MTLTGNLSDQFQMKNQIIKNMDFDVLMDYMTF